MFVSLFCMFVLLFVFNVFNVFVLSFNTHTHTHTLQPRIPHLVFISPDDSVLEASAAMLQHHIHRVAVLDVETHTLMFLMTHSVILNYLIASLQARSGLLAAELSHSLSQMGWMQVCVVLILRKERK
jgi:hypothetical protein